MPNYAKVVHGIRQAINQYGHAIIGVGSGRCMLCEMEEDHDHDANILEVPFSYTLGLYQQGYPELIIFSVSANNAHMILNELAFNMRQRLGAYMHGERVSLGGKFPLLAIEADKPETYEYLGWHRQIYKRDKFAVIQMVAPDTNGIYGPAGDPPYCQSPILSQRYPPGGH